MRVSREALQTQFEYFCREFGFRQATAYSDVGGLQLSMSYGAWWQIEEVVGPTGGVTHPFWTGGMKAADLIQSMRFAVSAHRKATEAAIHA